MADLADAAGRLVAVPLGAIARRRQGKPMHPRGGVYAAVLERHGSPSPWGVPWLDDVATQDATARLSRGAGLPAPLPDLLGLAVEIPGDDGPVHLLLSSSGRGRLTGRVPVPRRNAACAYSSIMAYRCAAGAVRLAAVAEARDLPSEPVPQAAAVASRPLVLTLAAARGTGPWQRFGRLTLRGAERPVDPDLRFDAVVHAPPGLVADGPLARFRAPAYATARAARSGRSPGGVAHRLPGAT